MVTRKNPDDFQLTLTGNGITIDTLVTKAIASQITALVMRVNEAAWTPSDAAEEHESSLPSQDIGGKPTPKAFMANKQPRTDMERVACLAYYLTHYKGIQHFKTRALTDLNYEAAQPKLSNPSFAARNAVQQEYLSLAGGGKKQITTRGEALVGALPDREKAKKALESHKPQRRTKRKIKKK